MDRQKLIEEARQRAQGLGAIPSSSPVNSSDPWAEYDKAFATQPTPVASKPRSELTSQEKMQRDTSNAADFTGGKEIAQGLGQAIANPKIAKDLNKVQTQATDIQTQLLQKIKEKKALGKDTSRLEGALADLGGNIQQLGDTTGELLNQNNLTDKKVLGDALQLAGTAGAGKVVGLANKVPIKGVGLLAGAAKGATTGAITGVAEGAIQGTAQGLQNNEDASGVGKDAITGAIAGGLGGAVLGGVIGGVSGKIQANKLKSQNFVDNLVAPKLSKKDMVEAIKTGKVIEGKGLGEQRDYSAAIPNLDKISESVKTVPGISKKATLLENSNAIKQEISRQADSLKLQLQNKGFFSPNEFKGYMNKVKLELTDNPVIVGDAEQTANKIISKFDKLVAEEGYTPSGLLEARKKLDYWMYSQKGSNVFDPAKENAVSVALRAIRQGGNNFIAEKVPDVAVKESLAHQSNLYQAIDNIAEKASKEGGNAFSRFWAKNPRIKALIWPVVGTAAAYGTGKVVRAATE